MIKITQNHKDLLLELIKTDFKLRYSGSVLGFVWVLLKPFFLFLIFYIVFSYIFAQGESHYSLQLILGLILFSYFSEGTTHGLTSLLSKANIILKVNFPRQIVVVASIINSFITLVVSFIIFFVFWIFNPTPITWLWLLFPIYLVILTLLIVGFSFFTSILFVRLRDLQSIWELSLQVILYASAIFYPISILPPQLRNIFFLNPIAVIIQQSRQILIYNQIPDLKILLVIFFASVIIFIFGYLFFKKNIKRLAEYF
ncbi:MAG: ABC transporter permease [Patescibacteria group bacterium]|nr:ABC transporter permease [Patescibacteria group bacterium]